MPAHKRKHIKTGFKKFGGWVKEVEFIVTGNEKDICGKKYYEYKNVSTGELTFFYVEY